MECRFREETLVRAVPAVSVESSPHIRLCAPLAERVVGENRAGFIPVKSGLQNESGVPKRRLASATMPRSVTVARMTISGSVMAVMLSAGIAQADSAVPIA